MSKYEVPELAPHSTHPFIGVRPGVASRIDHLIREVGAWHDKRLRFRAILGELEDEERTLILTPTRSSDAHFPAMLPHRHPEEGVLLIGMETREDPTIVCASPQSRIFFKGDLAFEPIQRIQECTLSQEVTFSRDWSVSEIALDGTARVPFLYMFPGTDHFRRTENLEQYNRASHLRGWSFDPMGNRRA